MKILGPEEALAVGGVEWKAELVDTAVVEESEGERGRRTREVPNHAVVTSVVPRETARAKEAEVVFDKTKDAGLPVEILASDTIEMGNEDEVWVPRFPCPKLYLHLVVRETGVPIPPAKDVGKSESGWMGVFWAAEWVFGSLSRGSEEGKGEKEGGTVPIHLTLERLYVGGVPATALSMALPMVVALIVGWIGVRPVLEGLLPKASKFGKEE